MPRVAVPPKVSGTTSASPDTSPRPNTMLTPLVSPSTTSSSPAVKLTLVASLSTTSNDTETMDESV